MQSPDWAAAKQHQIAAGRRLADARKRKNLSQHDLGELVGLSGPRISQFESGYSLPKAELREQLAQLLEAPDLFDPPQRRPNLTMRAGRAAQTISSEIVRLVEAMDQRKQQLALNLIRVLHRTALD